MADEQTDFPMADGPVDVPPESMSARELELLINKARARLESLEALRDSINWGSLPVGREESLQTFFALLK